MKAVVVLAGEQQRAHLALRANLVTAITEARADLLQLLTGNIQRRRTGLALLVLGLVVSAVGNVLSALW